jgi:hypothetical protein
MVAKSLKLREKLVLTSTNVRPRRFRNGNIPKGAIFGHLKCPFRGSVSRGGCGMGLRFRRSWNVIPGIRFNLGLKSGSVSFGMRGMHYTVGTRGSRVTVGLPGTGLFWTKKSAQASDLRSHDSQARPRPTCPPDSSRASSAISPASDLFTASPCQLASYASISATRTSTSN